MAERLLFIWRLQIQQLRVGPMPHWNPLLPWATVLRLSSNGSWNVSKISGNKTLCVHLFCGVSLWCHYIALATSLLLINDQRSTPPPPPPSVIITASVSLLFIYWKLMIRMNPSGPVNDWSRARTLSSVFPFDPPQTPVLFCPHPHLPLVHQSFSIYSSWQKENGRRGWRGRGRRAVVGIIIYLSGEKWHLIDAGMRGAEQHPAEQSRSLNTD